MFGPPGHAYVYFTYGNHYCMNVVTGPDGTAMAVLIRALEPLDGILIMKRRRGMSRLTDLSSGPGKLAQALSIDSRDYGRNLTREPLWICEDGTSPPAWTRTPRIGVSGGEDLPYRFVVTGSPYLSPARGRSRRSARASPALPSPRREAASR